MKAVDIDTMSWEDLAADRTKWRSALKQHLKTGEYKLMAAAADKRARRKEGSSSIRPEAMLLQQSKKPLVCIIHGHASFLTDGGLYLAIGAWWFVRC